MQNKTRMLLLSAALFAIPAPAALADTVVTETVKQQEPPPSVGRMINFNEFNLNNDNLLSSFEVGEMLFKFFDSDSSGTLDSAEYERKGILTVVPMQKETTITYDYDNDGLTDKTQHTYETFMQDTQLARFDANKDGLSPREFVDRNFFTANVDSSASIDLAEWRNAYMTRLAPFPALAIPTQ